MCLVPPPSLPGPLLSSSSPLYSSQRCSTQPPPTMEYVLAPSIMASPSSRSSRSHTSHSEHSASPSSSRLAQSMSSAPALGASSSSLGGDDRLASVQITLEQALLQHANAADPTRAALEAVLAERNGLSSQNTQLWNHIKKQKNSYAQAASDVKRLRAERDVLRVKVAKLGGTNGEHGERHLRLLHSAAPITETSSTDTTNDVESSFPAPTLQTDRRARVVRHQSDETPVTPPRRSASHERRAQTPVLTHSRSHDPIRGQDRERSNTHPEFTSPILTNGNEALDKTPSAARFGHQQVGSASASALNSLSVPGSQEMRTPAPLIVSSQTDSSSDFPPNTKSLNIVHKSHIDSLNSTEMTLVNLSTPPTSVPMPANTVTYQVPPVTESRPEFINGTSSGTHKQASANASAANLTPNYLVSPNSRMASRESRISLPDETKRYYANLPDSPLSSPRILGSTDTSTQTARGASGDKALAQVPEERESGSTDASPRPFLELETTDSDSERRLSGDTRVRETDSELDPEGLEDLPVDSSSELKWGDAASHLQTPKPRIATTVDQFPLPPGTLVTPIIRSPSSPTSIATTVNDQTNLNASTSSWSSTHPTLPNNALSPESNSRRSRDKKRDSFLTSDAIPHNPTFRQMPLLDRDLKTSTVEVTGSHIRANDKGKEVLSFVISVIPVGKEPWQIEKFYSDVLGLEARLRSKCSRAILKKLAPLPDAKLFKDHAPAKADQRKHMLKAYLQSVMALPIKDKNEIILFFSSDVMRERAPVTRSGYKEGYLTKRGKNFGGWKIRYFVVQGPVLEYYDSRGGNHLGSIQISNAQIGRQQKTATDKDSDDGDEFRHAFLIIEQKKGPAGQQVRHVLCAESDQDRDSWVDVLVRYVVGGFSEDDRAAVSQIPGPITTQVNGSGQPRSSTSSISVNEINSTPVRRGVSKDQIQKTGAMPVPISQLSFDKTNAKFFQTVPTVDESASSSPAKSSLGPSPIDGMSTSSFTLVDGKKSLDRISLGTAADDTQLSSSLPISSNLDVNTSLVPIGQRSNSELGHYPDLLASNGKFISPEHQRPRDRSRASYHPTLGTIMPSPTDRPASPDNTSSGGPSPSSRHDGSRPVKISGPLHGTPIPAGYKFGSKDTTAEQHSSNERDRKVKSRMFWGWRPGDKGAANIPTLQTRAVFGVPLEESLAVSQIANLPSIVFRCIQYLEENKADQEEGIYRLSGSSAVIKNLKDRFNAEGDVDLMKADIQDPHVITGLLKSFLRDLPASLLTHDLHFRFLAVMDFVDAQERVRELSELISQLPFPNYSLLRALTAHLILIIQNSNVNKMTMRNVGIVFSPTLGIPAGIFSLMLGEFTRVFNVNGEGVDSPADEQEVGSSSPKRLSGLNRRNSKQYTDAAADQLLGLSGRVLPTTEEDHSDDGDDISVNEESGAETTEADNEAQTVESSVDSVRAVSPALVYQEQVHPPPLNGEITPQKSHASHVAASRGLNINVNGAVGDRRRSRMIQGLPVSPRPMNHSPLSTPTSISQPNPSPTQTPR